MKIARHQLLGGIATGVLLLSAGAAWAQTAPADEAGEPIITVIGSRAPNRTVLDSPVPVDVIRGDSIRQAGSNGELAQSIGTLVPAFNFPRQSNSGVGDTVRAAQLRGMSPDQVLVLVNGKRYHTTSTPALDTKVGKGTAPVDLNTLPINGVGRLEVLRDGAAAQYGSDAVAGVINIGLDRMDHGLVADLTYGQNVTKPGAIDQTLHDGRNISGALKFGTKLGDGGFLTVGGDYTHQQGTNRAGYDQGGQFLSNGSYTDPRNDQFFGQRLFKVGDPRVDSGHLWYNAEAPVGGDLTFYSFGVAHYRKSVGANFFRWPVIVDGNGNDYLPPAQPNGTGGFRPKSVARNRDISFTAGIKGDLGDWRADASLTYGRNWISYRVKDSVNYSLGAASPNEFLLSKVRSDQLVANLDLSRDYEVGLAAPVTVSVGTEYRRENWRSSAGDVASYAVGPLADPASLGLQPGAQAGPGLTPDDARKLDRDVIAGYIELSTKLAPTVSADVAGRVEHYSDAGTSVAGKAALRWEFVDGFALRGSVSNSFRAPALAQRGASTTSLNFGAGGALRRVATLPVDSAVAQSLGAAKLKPEKSFNLSAGITAAPIDGLHLSIDAFRILVDNRITLSERFDLTGLSAAQRTALGLGTYDAINFFTNAVDLKTRGVEAVADYRFSVGDSKVGLSASYSYAKSSIRSVDAPPPQLAANGITGNLIGLEETNTLVDAAPRDKVILSADWAKGPFSALVRGIRNGSVVRVFDFGGGFAPRQKFGAEWQLDTEVSYTFAQGLTLSVGANNLFDNYPDQSSADINGAGNLAYDVLSPIGINGRYLYARARVAF